MTRSLSVRAALLALATCPMLAGAHDGHGPEGVHWHATDSWGFVVTAALVAAAVWFSRRK